jgi:hypothetical protein
MTLLLIAAAAAAVWIAAETVARIRTRRFDRHAQQAIDLTRVDELEQRRRAALIKALGGPA